MSELIQFLPLLVMGLVVWLIWKRIRRNNPTRIQRGNFSNVQNHTASKDEFKRTDDLRQPSFIKGEKSGLHYDPARFPAGYSEIDPPKDN